MLGQVRRLWQLRRLKRCVYCPISWVGATGLSWLGADGVSLWIHGVSCHFSYILILGNWLDETRSIAHLVHVGSTHGLPEGLSIADLVILLEIHLLQPIVGQLTT